METVNFSGEELNVITSALRHQAYFYRRRIEQRAKRIAAGRAHGNDNEAHLQADVRHYNARVAIGDKTRILAGAAYRGESSPNYRRLEQYDMAAQ